jgi:hypothetical protein
MPSPLARRAHNATNALHSLVYFAPETEERLAATGLEPGQMCSPRPGKHCGHASRKRLT